MNERTVRISLSSLPSDVLSACFSPCMDTEITFGPDGMNLTAVRGSRDPSVRFRVVTLMKAAGFINNDSVDASALSAAAFRVQTSLPGYCEVFYTVGDVTVPTAYHAAGSDYAGCDGEYILCDFAGEGERWRGVIHDAFRLDWSGWVMAGDSMVVSDVYLFADADEARAFVCEGNRGRKPYMPDGLVFDDQPETADRDGFYVCLHDERLVSGQDNVLSVCPTLDEAVRLCDENRVYGYRVADRYGHVVYAPYTLLQCDILREGKYVTDYVRTHSFRYGDAPINPGIDCRAGLVSCDRLVCWALYRLGFVDQPFTQGVVVSKFPDWCRGMGFTLLADPEALEPGDVMLVRPHPSGFPQHAFLFAGYCEKPETDPGFPAQVADPNAPAGPAVKVMYAFRYDCGSDARIQSVQPSRETLFRDAYTPVALFRPVATERNCLNWKRYL